MENTRSDLPDNESESESEPKPGEQAESQSEPTAGVEGESIVNKKITKAFSQVKMGFEKGKDHYNQSPRLKKVVYQGKFMPAFWTVTAIFSLFVNILFIGLLIFFGHFFFELKALIADGLITGVSDNLALMDKAHIVASVPVQTTVQLQDNLPVVFDLPINQSTQLSIQEDIRIPAATIYLNNTPVLTDLTLPGGTPIQVDLSMSIPVSQSVPVDITVPVSLLVPLDLPVNETDLHQSIVGLQEVIEPYKILLGSSFTSPGDFPLCNEWWSGWLCKIVFGKQ